MRLFAAILPPPDRLEALRDALAAVPPPGAGVAPKRRLLRRFGGSSSTVDAPNDQLDLVETPLMYLPITSFGNVTLGDSVHLAKALRAEAATWARPELRFSGGTALEWPGDESVWVKLGGDVDKLNVIGRGVPQIVQRLGFFVDRRQFRPWLAVATITETTSAPYLEALVATLESFDGEPWVQDSVSLMKGLPEGSEGPLPFEEMERMPLAGH